MTKESRNLIDNLVDGNFDSFKNKLFLVVSEKLQVALGEKKLSVSNKILEAQADAAAAEAEKQALFVDPMMAKEFFLLDMEYKGHTITIKSLGTGIGKPLVSYIDGEKFEIFTDKEIAVKESKQAIERMLKKGIKNIEDLRKTPEKIKSEKQQINVNKEDEKKTK
jgi:hypothetical protein